MLQPPEVSCSCLVVTSFKGSLIGVVSCWESKSRNEVLIFFYIDKLLLNLVLQKVMFVQLDDLYSVTAVRLCLVLLY